MFDFLAQAPCERLRTHGLGVHAGCRGNLATARTRSVRWGPDLGTVQCGAELLGARLGAPDGGDPGAWMDGPGDPYRMRISCRCSG